MSKNFKISKLTEQLKISRNKRVSSAQQRTKQRSEYIGCSIVSTTLQCAANESYCSLFDLQIYEKTGHDLQRFTFVVLQTFTECVLLYFHLPEIISSFD